MANKSDEPYWIFGYGSLIFRTGFPFIEKRPAHIKHWARRFWQGSTDHRGIPGAPGRVVTLVPAPEYNCWGIAYRIAAKDFELVIDSLDFREKGGYKRLKLPLYFEDKTAIEGITYHAMKGNPDYLGEAPLADMARQILRSSGPSGTNIDYLNQLVNALSALEVLDPHIAELATAVKEYGDTGN